MTLQIFQKIADLIIEENKKYLPSQNNIQDTHLSNNKFKSIFNSKKYIGLINKLTFDNQKLKYNLNKYLSDENIQEEIIEYILQKSDKNIFFKIQNNKFISNTCIFENCEYLFEDVLFKNTEIKKNMLKIFPSYIGIYKNNNLYLFNNETLNVNLPQKDYLYILSKKLSTEEYQDLSYPFREFYEKKKLVFKTNLLLIILGIKYHIIKKKKLFEIENFLRLNLISKNFEDNPIKILDLQLYIFQYIFLKNINNYYNYKINFDINLIEKIYKYFCMYKFFK